MDDLLKRLLAVEKEAEAIVTDAEAQAKKLMAEARKKANENDEKEQAESAKDYESILGKALEQAQQQRSTQLHDAEANFDQKAKDFTDKLMKNREDVVNALLGF